jgi:hypothetical protein
MCGYDFPRHPGGGSGGGPDYRFLAIKALENVNRSLSALCALIENVAIAFGIEVKGIEAVSENRGGNVPVESPVEGVKEETAVRISAPGISGKV